MKKMLKFGGRFAFPEASSGIAAQRPHSQASFWWFLNGNSLSGEERISLLVRGMFASYYLPVVALLVTGVGGFLMNLIFSLLIPLIHTTVDHLEMVDKTGVWWDNDAVKDTKLDDMMMDVSSLLQTTTTQFVSTTTQNRLLFLQMHFLPTLLPVITLALCMCVFANKLLNSVVEAMVDSFTSSHGKDYPLTGFRLNYMLESTRRRNILLVIVAWIAFRGTQALFNHSALLNEQREMMVFFAVTCIISVEICFVLGTMLMLVLEERRNRKCNTLKGGPNHTEDVPALLDNTFILRWWSCYIDSVRFTSALQLFGFTIYWSVMQGPLDAISCFAEAMMNLNLPHLIGFFILSVAMGLNKSIRVIQWLFRHPGYFLPAFLASSPFNLTLLWCLHHFITHYATVSDAASDLVRQASMIFVELEQSTVETATTLEKATSMKPLLLLLMVCFFWNILRATELCMEHYVSPGKQGAKVYGNPEWYYIPTESVKSQTERSESSSHLSSPLGLDEESEDVEVPLVAVASQYAALLEDTWERNKKRPTMLGLDTSFDLARMRLFTTESGPHGFSLVRRHNAGVPAMSPLLALKFLPRLLSLQGRGSFSGAWFHNTRVILRVFLSILFILLTSLVAGVILQSVIPSLHPVPLDISTSGSEILIDHLVSAVTLKSSQVPLEKNLIKQPLDASLHDVYTHLCTLDFDGVSVLELALQSIAAYCTSDQCVTRILDWMNQAEVGSGDWILVNKKDFGAKKSPVQWQGFLELFSKQRNTTVIAIRGTDPTSFFDMLQDVDLFYDVALFQILSHFVPGLSLMPSNIVTDFMRIGSWIEKLGDLSVLRRAVLASARAGRPVKQSDKKNDEYYQRHYYKQVLDYVHENGLLTLSNNTRLDADFGGKEVKGQRQLLFTGHSLGGFLSQILGATTHRHTMAFHSPGLAMNLKKFGIMDVEDVHSWVSNVISTHDLFPHLGWQGGTLFNVQCSVKGRGRELCHAMEILVSNLWGACPSLRQRFPKVTSIK